MLRFTSTKRLWRLFWLITVVALASGSAGAQEGACFNSRVGSIPSRPTVASATDVTQCGVVELEYGVERQWVSTGVQHSDFSGGIRFGLAKNLDFHWYSGNVLSFSDPTGTQRGYGDNWFGLKYRYLGQTKHRPSLGVQYEAKMPTGNVLLGMSSGEVDHALALIASKDIRRFHFDFNVIPQLIGLPGGAGFDHNAGFAWATWLPVTKRVTLVTEPYGYTALNLQTDGYASWMAGCSVQVRPRLYLDGGMDFGVTATAPHSRVYGGVTFAVANVYRWVVPQGR